MDLMMEKEEQTSLNICS